MKIVNARRISQLFFFFLFLWFCIVSTFGTEWWQLRGWPVNLILQLDPLVAVGTLLTTHTIYKGLILAVLTVVMTFIFGRVFCGWICPFGATHQFIGYLGNRGRKVKDRIQSNRYRKAASLKYIFLIAFLVAAAIPLGSNTLLFTGLLDPIPFFHRSVNIVLLPVIDHLFNLLSVEPRVYEGAFLVAVLFAAAIFMNLLIPRFYCRFICPTGALLGLASKYAVLRIGRIGASCSNCMICESACEGACEPSRHIRINECVVCLNCYDQCGDEVFRYGAGESGGGEISTPDLTRRGLIISSLSGLLAIQIFPLSMGTSSTKDNTMVRPPGSLPEADFLQRCIRCGQCMRICPTNIIVPSGAFNGVENIWTPVLNFTDGTSGCQLNCTACGHVCPTSAIRAISQSEKLGTDEFAKDGPVRIGSAYVDRTRCLPWAMNTPCIVCQENCPVTPKAIYLSETYEAVRSGRKNIVSAEGSEVQVSGQAMEPGQYATGDYYIVGLSPGKEDRHRITSNTENRIEINSGEIMNLGKDNEIEIQIHLSRPVVDRKKCIGCGNCMHECPVGGRRAIRVTSDNETRGVKKAA